MSLLEQLLLGKTLAGRYTVREPLGRGGMGAVFKTYDGRLNRWVALKVITTGVVSDEQEERGRRRFEREARVAAGLNHPNVVTVHDFGIDDGLEVQYLVMELLSGVNLRTYLNTHGPPPADLALQFVEQAAQGLAAGHRAGLVHRDVKPENLFLLDDEKRVVLLDFGIALEDSNDRTVTQLTVADVGPHSPAYAAPEQLRGGSITPATDVFCLAATAFELFTGSRVAPPQGCAGDEAPLKAAHLYLTEQPEKFGGAQRALKLALAARPEERPRDAAAFLEALGKSRNPTPVTGAAPPREAAARTEAHYSEEAFQRVIKRSIGRPVVPAQLNAVATERGYPRREIMRVGSALGIDSRHLELALAEEDVRTPLPEIPSAFADDGICSQWTIPAGRVAAQQELSRLMLKGGDFTVARRASDATAWRRADKKWPEVDNFRLTSNGLHFVKEVITSVSPSGSDETLVRLDAQVAIRDADLGRELRRMALPVGPGGLRLVRDPEHLNTALFWMVAVLLLVAAVGIGRAFDLFSLDLREGLRYYAALGLDAFLWLLFLLAAMTARWSGKMNAAKTGYRSIIDEKKGETLDAFQRIFDELSQLGRD